MDAVELGEHAARLGLAAAALLAWRVSRPSCSPHFRPVAAVLSAAFAADGARALLRVFVLGPARLAGRVPYEGIDRVVFHLEELLWLSFPAMSVALAFEVFLRRVPSAVWTSWFTTAAVLAIAYPTLRGDALLRVYLVAHLASVAVQLVLAAIFFARSIVGRRGIPGVSQHVALALACSDIAALVGPWAAGYPLRDWYTCLWPATLVWLVVLGYEARATAWTALHVKAAAKRDAGSSRSSGQPRFSPSWLS